MDFNAAGKVEAPFDRCFDDGDLLQTDHREQALSYVRVNVLVGFISGRVLLRGQVWTRKRWVL
jgi:hypothetical protein